MSILNPMILTVDSDNPSSPEPRLVRVRVKSGNTVVGTHDYSVPQPPNQFPSIWPLAINIQNFVATIPNGNYDVNADLVADSNVESPTTTNMTNNPMTVQAAPPNLVSVVGS